MYFYTCNAQRYQVSCKFFYNSIAHIFNNGFNFKLFLYVSNFISTFRRLNNHVNSILSKPKNSIILKLNTFCLLKLKILFFKHGKPYIQK